MKRTNYHLFDWLDFDEQLQRDEHLFKLIGMNGIHEHDGAIYVDALFQKQELQNDMSPCSDELPVCHTLIIKAYTEDIVRVFISMCGDELSDTSEMLSMSPGIQPNPLHIKEGDGVFHLVDTSGIIRGTIDLRAPELDPWSDLLPPPQGTLNLALFPEGDPNKAIRLSDDHFSPPRYDALPIGYCEHEGHAERATLSLCCTEDECFCGTGERFRKMDLSGQSFRLKNQDGQGVNNRRCYKNIPFYLSSKGYAAFFHTTDYCSLSLADHSTRSVQFLCDRSTVDLFLIGGKNPEQLLYRYRELTGFPPALPLWSYGIWMSRMTYFSADEVEEICRRLRSEHYPCDVIHLDTGWFRTDWLCEWKFNPKRFPDPEGFLQRLLSQGFRVSLWQLPYIADGAEQLEEARQNDYIAPLTKRQSSDGSNFSALDYAGTIDFTYPAATQWYQGLLRKLLRMGVKCIKTDFGENIHMDAIYKGSTPEQLNNLYALLYQKAAYEVTKEETGDGIIWARAGWAGCQRYPLHWGGDSASTWEGMAGSLRGGLHFGLSGFAFWSHDVPGFHSVPDFMNSPVREDIYLRWTQFGVFTSHIRYHGTSKREPWHYPGIAPLVRRWWQLRYRLLPYIWRESEHCTQSGLPMLSALLLHHADDPTCWHIDDEYYFGRSFLVAPVMNSDNKRDIYLPEGAWVDFFTGERYEGGRWLLSRPCPPALMPVFVRPGTQLPIYPEDVNCTDEMDLSRQELLTITEGHGWEDQVFTMLSTTH